MSSESEMDRRLALRLHAVSLRQLRFLVALADSGSFSRAARAAGVSQPALSAAIRQVETLLDIRLFDRDTHRVALTTAGAAILPHARRLLITADHAFSDMADAALGRGATVRVGGVPSALPAVAETLVRLAPEVDGLNLHLVDGKSDALIEQLHVGALDLVVGVQGRVDPKLVAVPLAEDEMLLVVRSDHSRAGERALPWSALAGQEIVHFNGGSIGELVSAAMRQNDLARSARFQVDQVESLLALVRAGLAVGVLPRLYTQGVGEGLALIPLVAPVTRRHIVLLRRRSLAREHPQAERLAGLLAHGFIEVLSTLNRSFDQIPTTPLSIIE